MMRQRLGCVLCVIFACHTPGAAVQEKETSPNLRIHLSPPQQAADPQAFEIQGVPSDTLRRLADAQLSTAQWQTFFSVHTGLTVPATSDRQPPVSSTYRVHQGRLQCFPRFGLQPGLAYTVCFDPAHLPVESFLPEERLVQSFTLPEMVVPPDTVVAAIYPSAKILPENLLKFYLYFSKSMAAAQAYQHVTLLDAAGDRVELPFLEIEQELWDPSQCRLTLLLDPGRIKRDLKPHREVGPPLRVGQSYTLLIHEDWPDARGLPLKASFRKTFQVGPFENTPPDPRPWTLTPPPPQSTTPLRITFRESLDHALATRCITVHNATTQAIAGQVQMTDHDMIWQFIPTQPWAPGHYTLRIATILEDLAGNSVGRLFEVDLTASASLPSIPESLTLPFSVHSFPRVDTQDSP